MTTTDPYAIKDKPDLTVITEALRQALEAGLAEPWPEDDHWISVAVAGVGYAVQFDDEAAYVYVEDDSRIHTDTVLAIMPRPEGLDRFKNLTADGIEILPHGRG